MSNPTQTRRQITQRRPEGGADRPQCAPIYSRFLRVGFQASTAAFFIWATAQAASPPMAEDAFAACYPKGRPIECGLIDQFLTECVVAEERYRYQEKKTRRCEATVVGQRRTSAELVIDPKARQAALEEVAILADRLARSIGVEFDPRGQGMVDRSGISRTTIGAQSGPSIYSSRECLGAVVDAQCQGTVIPEGSYRLTCHGQLVNGVCSGPIF